VGFGRAGPDRGAKAQRRQPVGPLAGEQDRHLARRDQAAHVFGQRRHSRGRFGELGVEVVQQAGGLAGIVDRRGTDPYLGVCHFISLSLRRCRCKAPRGCSPRIRNTAY
jgi:hypothetical protein